jgi:hypothetical protein
LTAQYEQREAHPTEIESTKPLSDAAEIDPAQRQVEQKYGDARFNQERQQPSHRRVISHEIDRLILEQGRLHITASA